MAITILTGAGASRPLSYPTTAEFFSGAPEAETKPHIEVFKILREMLGVGQLDVEDALSLTEPVEKFVRTEPGKLLCHQIANGWHNKIKNFSTWARSRCFDLYGVDPAQEEVEKLYLPLLEVCGWKEHRLSLYTTNYDPVTDVLADIAHEYSVPCFDGFNSRSQWHPDGYRKDRTGVDIFRLHGSMCWLERSGRIVNTRDYSQRKGNVNHLLIYPGYKGNPEADRQEAFSFPHRQLRKDLAQSSLFIAIGFAFRDEHINSIVKDALSKNSTMKVLIINPEMPEGKEGFLKKRSGTVISPVSLLQGKFGELDLEKELPRLLSKT